MNSEEQLVKRKFRDKFKNKCDFIDRQLKLYSKIIESSQVDTHLYNKYALATLACENYKLFYKSYELVQIGYTVASEGLFKQAIEALISQIYLSQHPVDAEKWIKGKTIKSLNKKGRKGFVETIDKLNEETKFFPTNYKNFFQKYIYEAGYGEANKVAHLDFQFVYNDLENFGLKTDNKTLTTSFVLGANYTPKYSETTLNRVLMYLMFQITYVWHTMGKPNALHYDSLFEEFEKILVEH
jgi:hypothetical protein